MATRQQILTRHWVHSHEEDTATQTVFRPATYDFPLSRGRRSFELRPDGTLVERGPGPTDRSEVASGTWSYSGDQLTLESGPGQGPRQYRVESIEPDKLVLRRA